MTKDPSWTSPLGIAATMFPGGHVDFVEVPDLFRGTAPLVSCAVNSL